MAIEKILNTRIQLKYDSFENWKSKNPLLKSGEVAIAYLTTAEAVKPGTGDTQHPVLFKVGPGNFNDLPWTSALAADVHGWAKKTEAEFTTWVKGLIEVTDIDTYSKAQIDQKLSDNSKADQKYAKDYADGLAKNYDAAGTAQGLIEELDVTDTAVEGKYVSAVSETDGKISVTRADLPTYTLATGSANGTVAFNGADVAVKGLGSAAYTESSAYATSDQGALADSAMQNVTIHGHVLADGDALTVEQTKTDLGLGSAAYTEASAYATAAQGSKADSAVQSVTIGTGSENGKVKLTVDGNDVEAAVAGLGSAAFTPATNYATSAQGAKADTAVQSVTVLGKTLSNGQELTVAEGKTALGLGSAAYENVDAFDAAGSADAAKQAAIEDAAKKYATIVAVEEAQADATLANQKIDAFMSDEAKVEGAINTLVEINKYITEDTAAFTALSGRVDKLEDGTTPAKEAEHADVASGLDETGVAQVKGIKVDNATNADVAAKASGLDASGEAAVKAVKVDNAGHADSADDASKLGGVAAANYALKTDAEGYAKAAQDAAAEDATNKANAAQTAAATDATNKADKALKDAKDYADGLAGNYATAAQGAKADTAVQAGSFAGKAMTKTDGTLSISKADAQAALGLGSAAYTDSTAYATSAQGAKADTAVQKVVTGTGNGTIAVDGTDVAVKGLGSAAYTNSDAYATAAQGTKADSALQSVEVGTGLKVTEKANNKQTIEIDEDVIFVFNCGSASEVF